MEYREVMQLGEVVKSMVAEWKPETEEAFYEAFDHEVDGLCMFYSDSWDIVRSMRGGDSSAFCDAEWDVPLSGFDSIDQYIVALAAQLVHNMAVEAGVYDILHDITEKLEATEEAA